MLKKLFAKNRPAVPTLQPGTSYRLKGFTAECDAKYRHKMLAMGFVPGVEFKAVRVAPLGDPIELAIKGFLVSLRRREIALLQLEAV